ALGNGLVHAFACAAVGNPAPGKVCSAAIPLITVAAGCPVAPVSFIPEEFRMRSTPLLMVRAILVHQHPEANTGTFISSVTELAQALSLFCRAVLRLNRRDAKHGCAGNNYRGGDERPLGVHDYLHRRAV